MYSHEPPRDLKPDWLEQVAACPASDGVGSKLPAPHLDRWKAIHLSVVDWHSNDDSPYDIADRLFGWMDPVQREIADGLFAIYRTLMPRREYESFDFEPSPHHVPHPTDNAQLRAFVQMTVTGPDGVELVKLKTGKATTSGAELAVLVADAPEGASLVEVRLADGDLRVLDMDPDTQQQELDHLHGLWDTHRQLEKKPRNPGWHCLSCSRVARCGQYPFIGQGKATSTTRTVVVSKTWLERIPQCERQVAWKRLYGIPDDTGDDTDGFARSTGTDFHELIAPALLADNPAEVFANGVGNAPASEQQTLRWLFERHLQLVAEEPHPVTVSRTEYDIGVTLPVHGLDIDSYDKLKEDAEVAVVFTARTDAVGREPDGTAAVIEHRTGGQVRETNFETDLYAVSAAWLLGDEKVAVHVHRLGLQEGPECERVLYDQEQLAAAVERLRTPASTIAGWHPINALSPSFTVGEWCVWCPFRQRCERHR